MFACGNAKIGIQRHCFEGNELLPQAERRLANKREGREGPSTAHALRGPTSVEAGSLQKIEFRMSSMCQVGSARSCRGASLIRAAHMQI